MGRLDPGLNNSIPTDGRKAKLNTQMIIQSAHAQQRLVTSSCLLPTCIPGNDGLAFTCVEPVETPGHHQRQIIITQYVLKQGEHLNSLLSGASGAFSHVSSLGMLIFSLAAFTSDWLKFRAHFCASRDESLMALATVKATRLTS